MVRLLTGQSPRVLQGGGDAYSECRAVWHANWEVCENGEKSID